MYSNDTFRRGYGNEQDDEEELMNKTSRLKQITISLGNEIRESNKYIKGLDDDFDKSKNFLEATIGKVTKLARYGNCKIYFYLLLFSFFVFFILYLVIKWF